jgi:Ubiquitin-2 like Rad60 SUMO-like
MYQLRFRHLNGDIGPLAFEESATVADMKSATWDHWPENGPLASMVRSQVTMDEVCWPVDYSYLWGTAPTPANRLNCVLHLEFSFVLIVQLHTGLMLAASSFPALTFRHCLAVRACGNSIA